MILGIVSLLEAPTKASSNRLRVQYSFIVSYIYHCPPPPKKKTT